MDYCSSCRRHLNGALVCPGCGAYAPDIAPTTGHGHSNYGDHGDGHGFAPFAAKTPPRPEPQLQPQSYDPFEETGAAEAAIPVTAGRAARRRQRARWKKNQRRAVVATAVALVGGGLTISTMNSGSGHRDQASAAPDLTSTGAQDLPAQQYAEPTADRPGTGKHRKPDSTTDGSTASGDAQRRSATTPDSPHTTSARTRPYSAPDTTPSTAQPRTATTSSTGTASGGTGSTTPSQSPSATTGGDTSSSGSSGSSGSSASQPSSSQSDSSGSGSSGSSTSPSGDTAATSPSGICVLGLLCLS